MNFSGIQQLSFKNLKDATIIKIPSEGGTIGRYGDIEPDYFRQFQYVSRQHARIYFSHGKYMIKDLNSKNGTKVNNLKINDSFGSPIRGGDLVSIADLEFRIIYTSY